MLALQLSVSFATGTGLGLQLTVVSSAGPGHESICDVSNGVLELWVVAQQHRLEAGIFNMGQALCSVGLCIV